MRDVEGHRGHYRSRNEGRAARALMAVSAFLERRPVREALPGWLASGARSGRDLFGGMP